MITYIFKASFSHYILIENSEDAAWLLLARKLSCSMDNAKKRAKLIHWMNGLGENNFKKIK
jgi:hypothetical protein